MPVWKQDEGGEWRYGVSFQPGPNMPQRVAKASVKNFILQPEGSDAAMLLVSPVSLHGKCVIFGCMMMNVIRKRYLERCCLSSRLASKLSMQPIDAVSYYAQEVLALRHCCDHERCDLPASRLSLPDCHYA